jgi:hypothetical protein
MDDVHSLHDLPDDPDHDDLPAALAEHDAGGGDVMGRLVAHAASRLWLTTSTLWPSGSSTKAP